MRLAVLVGTTAALAACATTSPPSAASWLVGTWLMMEPGVEHPLACASGLPITYEGDGSWALMDSSGTWRLEGLRLTETVTDVSDSADDGAPQVGRTYIAEVERTGPDAFRKTYADGVVESFRRCPP